jgi:hypothetical protein
MAKNSAEKNEMPVGPKRVVGVTHNSEAGKRSINASGGQLTPAASS